MHLLRFGFSSRSVGPILPCLLLATLCLSAVFSLRAANVAAVSNLGQPFANFSVVGRSTADFQQAVSFTTGEISTELSSINLYGNAYGDPVTAFTVRLYSGFSAAGPSGSVATLVGDNPASLSSTYSYRPATVLTLPAYSTYWLVVSAPSLPVSGFSWRSTSSSAKDSGSLTGWNIGSVEWSSNNGGGSWFQGSLIPQFVVEVNEPLPTAPAITIQPTPQTAFTGANVTLSVTATGHPALSFQWRKDGVVVPGATSSTLVLTSISTDHAGSYTVAVSNSAGSVTSRAAVLSVTPTLTAVANLGQPFQILQVVDHTLHQAIGFTTGPAITNLYTLTLHGSGFGSVSGLTVAIYGGFGSAGPTGLVGTLVGNARPTSLSIYTYVPATALKLAADTTYYVVVSAPSAAPSSGFSWRSTGSFTEDAIALSGWSIADTRWVTNNGGASWFSVAGPIPQFQVNTTEPALAITGQPTAQTGVAGRAVTLFVSSTGDSARSFQWRKDGVAIPGATSSNLTLASAAKSDAGSYSVVVTSSAGSITSRAAILDVNPASSLSNFSVRTTMATGQVLIVGAVVSGGAKTILVRAAGPALNGFGLQGMVDPRLDLFTTGTAPAAINDDWAAALSPTFASVGAFPFTSASKDAALSQSVNGGFTVQTRGTGEGTVLVETYDIAGGVVPRLINFSARNRVGTGSDILIAGISLSGTGTKQILIRAVGPGLAVFGVTGILVDPRVQVISSSGSVIGTNDNWDSTLTATFNQLGAFSLPANSRDSALLLTVDAGATYTVQVSGADGGTGEALIEVYEIF